MAFVEAPHVDDETDDGIDWQRRISWLQPAIIQRRIQADTRAFAEQVTQMNSDGRHVRVGATK